jgi:hypothetical protein
VDACAGTTGTQECRRKETRHTRTADDVPHERGATNVQCTVYCLSIRAASAVLAAWAFMLRSREYVAVPSGGSRPMRWKQVMFRGKDGNTLTGTGPGAGAANAERVTLRIPSTKNGMQEVTVTRSIETTGSGLCCVSALQSLHAGLFGRPDNARPYT